ncbi:MAG: multicopper oxidase domain-containing protein [Bacteroidia bacterium]|nr:multicopper oxidase domain-containing protein [Bacteroidia bacterium]
MRLTAFFILVYQSLVSQAQNPLYIPPALTGPVFNLNIQSGSKMFYGTNATPTYGVNGSWMAPTLIVNKGDSITLHVKNGLSVKTTMHWHGLHVAAKNDGGPHQIILPLGTWSPSFKIRNNAATFWYHPHGAGQTDPQVSKGLAGFIIVRDSTEASLNLPRTYGLDDIPLNVQSKAFDELKQIAISTDMDTALFVNGTLHPLLNVPQQVVRFRLLNGSSLRSYNLGFSNGQIFYQIATDGGLLDTPVTLSRLRLSPGERAEILVNFSGLIGQTINLKSYSSELAKGIYGADSIGKGIDIIDAYNDNFLNGSDFNLLQINIGATSVNPVITVPLSLVPFKHFNITSATRYRKIEFDTIRLLPADVPNLADGPFGMNHKSFDMETINEIVHLNTTEIWTLVNHTLVAHPFHIHDVQFEVIEKNGKPISISDKGWKDVVLIMPNDSVKFISRFETFSDPMVPYMYHCHLLHHEDDGMMASFLVIDTSASTGIINVEQVHYLLYPNPAINNLTFQFKDAIHFAEVNIINVLGEIILKQTISNSNSLILDVSTIKEGMYFIQVIERGNTENNRFSIQKFIKQ